MHPFMFILKLATLKKMPDKKAVLRAAAVNGCTQLFEGFQLAFDKKRIFNVKSAPLIEIDTTMSQKELMKPGTYTWSMFKALLGLLEKNDLDDATKKKLLYEAAEESGILEWNAFYRPILMKNLKCGISAKSINTILYEFGADAAKYKVPIWKIQKLSNGGLHTGEKYVEPLLHGKRAITIINKDLKIAKMFSETGIEIKTHKIKLEPLVDLSYQFPTSIVLDGNIVNRDYGNLMIKDCGDVEYYAIYDILLLNDFNQNYCPISLQDRKKTLNDLNGILRDESKGRIYILPSLLLNFSDNDYKKKLQEFQDEAMDGGYTAIVIKDAKSFYTCEKDISWYKQKIPSK